MNFCVDNRRAKAVLFDLDDTLFDHKFSRLQGLTALQEEFPQLEATAIEELEKEHERLLSADYERVLDRKITVFDGTTQRIAKLCAMHGVSLELEESKAAASIYRKAYMKNRRPVPGSRELLTALENDAVLGVVTNGLLDQQIEKLRVCKVSEQLDFIVISEAVGCRKPSREIFEVALKRAKVKPCEAVYVGDSWVSDVLPAVNVGMKAVWLNRYDLKCPDPDVAREIDSFVGADAALVLKW